MDKFNNIDDLFANLGNDEKQAPSGAWEYILADQKRKKKAGMLWWFYGTVGLLLIAGLVGYYQLKNDNTKLQTTNITKNEILSNADNAATANKDIYNGAATGTPDAPRNNFVAAASYMSSNPSSNLNNYTSKDITPNNITNSEAVADIKSSNHTEEVYTKATTASKDEIVAVEEDAPLKIKDLKKEEKEKEKTIRKTSKPKIQKYFIEADLMVYTYSFRSLSGGADMADYISQRNRSEVALHKPAISIAFGKSIYKNWNVQAGLLYNVQGLSASYTVSTAQKKVFVEVDPTLTKYSSSTNYIYVHDSVYKIEKGNAVNGDQKYHYIRAPFMLEWQHEFKRFTLYAGGGMSLNFLVAARGDIQDYQSTQSGVFIPINQISLQRFGCDFTSRLGGLLPIPGMPAMKFSFAVRGMYSPISAFGKDVPIKQHNYSLGLEMGIRKMLN